MMKKSQLILDVAGVIVTNLSPSFWQEIAKAVDISFNDFKSIFKKEVRHQLWTGTMSEESFWSWVHNQFPTLEMQHIRKSFHKHLIPLPAISQISHWSARADIHLLSNHRHEWITPLIQPIAMNLTSITISSEVGCCKPDPTIYRLVHNKLADQAPAIIFVDDQEKNMAPARELGWETVIADQEGNWITEITNRLNGLT
jgi:putative hydrolase of the HAD superfamily